MGKQIIFLDIDGTLLKFGEELDDRVVQAIHDARKRGHLVFLSTGRSKNDTPDFIEAIGFDGRVYSAGAYIEVGDEVIYDHPIEAEKVQEISRHLDENEVIYRYECLNDTYASYIGEVKLEGDLGQFSSEVLRLFKNALKFDSMDDYQGEAVYKILVNAPDAERILKASESFPEDIQTVVFQNFMNNLDIVVAEISDVENDKGKAILRVCEAIGHDPKDTIAIGDSGNDLAMILQAGRGIAMGNASEDLKEAADEICEDIDHAGVALVLNDLD